MNYLIHFLIPLGLVILRTFLLGGNQNHVTSFAEQVLMGYVMLSLVYWGWALFCLLFKALKPVVNSSFVMLHCLWCIICYVELTLNEHSLSNTWVMFYISAPVAIMMGVFIGFKINKHNKKKEWYANNWHR